MSAPRKSAPNASQTRATVQLRDQMASTNAKPKKRMKMATFGPITGFFIFLPQRIGEVGDYPNGAARIGMKQSEMPSVKVSFFPHRFPLFPDRSIG
jgi:hypothetical protein